MVEEIIDEVEEITEEAVVSLEKAPPFEDM